jgi:hypothetical protein
VVNGNYGTGAPIVITDIYEVENPLGISYLEITPEHELPYTLSGGESFQFIVRPNAQTAKGQITTFVFVESSDGRLEFAVTVDETLVSVTEISAETKLYPNPTSGQFTVEGVNVSKVEVYNLVGQKVYEAEGKEIGIDAVNWNKGIYLVNIINQNGAVETRKLVVK